MTSSRPVLVTGGAGYVGSHTVRRLQQDGADVVVVDDLSTGHVEAVSAPLEVVDLRHGEALRDVFLRHRPRAVVHFAARSLVGQSVTDPAPYYDVNVRGTWNLIEAMRASDCRDVVFSSTCATYGEPRSVPIDEDHPRDPISPYGRSKLHIEHMLEDASRAYGLRCAALRYFNAAGAAPEADLGEDHDPETHLIPIVLQVALGQRDSLMIFGDDYPTPDGTCIRDYVHVLDLAEAHVRALECLAAGEERIVCNLGTGTGSSVREVLDAARRVTGCAIPVKLAERRPGDPPELVAGGSCAHELLGWTPQRSGLQTILEDAWRFHRLHPNGFAPAGSGAAAGRQGE